MVGWRFVRVFSDQELLAELTDLRHMHLELGNPRVPFHSNEWGGRNRQEAYEEVHRDLLDALDECKARGLPVHAILYPDLYKED